MLSSLLAIVIVAVVIGTSASEPPTTDARASGAVSAPATVTVPAGGTGKLGATIGVRAPNDVAGVSGGAGSAAGIGKGVVEDTTPWPPSPADPTPAVTTAVAEAEAAGVHQAVVIMDRTTGTLLTQLNADQRFPALSLVKLMIAADVLSGADPSGVPNLDSTAAPAGTVASDGAGGSDVPVGAIAPDPADGSNTLGGPVALTGPADPAGADPAIRALAREMIIRSDDVTATDLYQRAGGDAMVDRIVQRYALTGSTPTPDGVYWGNVQTSAADMASLLNQILADAGTASVIAPAMLATSAYAQDGVDQRIGMRTVPAAGSKQGWGCCLSGVVGIHSVGFTPDRIVVVLSAAAPDDDSLSEQDGLALQADPGGRVSIAAVTATVHAALGGPAS
jgi:Beta-lactamase enzyme family